MSKTERKEPKIMASFDDFAFKDATALADLVRRKEVTPLELVDATIEGIERINPALNAVVTPMYDEARASASGEIPDGPFRGVPYLLKDLLASYKGVRMTAGSRFLLEYVPDHDSTLVSRLKRAGLIVVGKTNTPEFGVLPTTEPALFGPARNPWDTIAYDGRLKRRVGCGRRLGDGADGARKRRRRVNTHPGFVLRGVRAKADEGAKPARARFRRHVFGVDRRACRHALRAR